MREEIPLAEDAVPGLEASLFSKTSRATKSWGKEEAYLVNLGEVLG